MTEGQTVYVRDQLHPSYAEWGMGIFIRLLDEHYYKVLVEYFDSNTKKPLGVCGKFPEVKECLEKNDIPLDRRFA